MTTNLETLKKMRDKAMHRYTLAERSRKRAMEEYSFCCAEITLINNMIETEKKVASCKTTS